MVVTLFCLALIFLPFNDLPWLSAVFGELGQEGAFLPLWLATLAFLFHRDFSFVVPRLPSATYLLLFAAVIVLSGVVNGFSILQAEFAGRSGPAKYFLQLMVFLFGVSLALLVCNLLHLGLINLRLVRRFLTISFLIAGGYSIFEVLFLLGVPWAETLLSTINPLFHTEEQGIIIYSQVRSVTGEPSWFGMYAALLFPWLVSYLFTEERPWPYAVLTLYLIFLVFLSSSRLAYGLFFVEALLLVGIMVRARIFKPGATILGLLFLSLTVFISYSLIDLVAGAETALTRQGLLASLASEENLSNLCRYGTQVAALNIAWDHPLLGTGLGQFPFYMEHYLPAWSMVSPEIRAYLRGEGLPRVHGLYARLLSEVGMVGLALWLGFLAALMRQTWRTFKASFPGTVDWLGLSIVINLVAMAAFGLSTGSFRSPGMWITIGLAWGYGLGGLQVTATGESP